MLAGDLQRAILNKGSTISVEKKKCFKKYRSFKCFEPRSISSLSCVIRERVVLRKTWAAVVKVNLGSQENAVKSTRWTSCWMIGTWTSRALGLIPRRDTVEVLYHGMPGPNQISQRRCEWYSSSSQNLNTSFFFEPAIFAITSTAMTIAAVALP